MSSVVISGDTSGAITIAAPAVAGTYTQTLPMITGTLGTLNSGTAVASTSGTSIDFTSIPANVRRITVMFNGVSLNGSSSFLVQIGNGTPTTTGYSSITSYVTSAATCLATTSTNGFIVQAGAASHVAFGSLTLSNVSGNTWVASGVLGNIVSSPFTINTAGVIALGSALNMVRITTVNGTDTFDAGSINILYE